MIESLLKSRFGNLDLDLQGAIALMLQLPKDELMPLLLNLSREELLQRFS